MRLFPSLSEREARLKAIAVRQETKSTWRLLFVSIFDVRDITIPSDYCGVAKAIDRYIQARSEEQSGLQEKLDPRLCDIIEGIFRRCIEDREYKQVSPVDQRRVFYHVPT